MLEQSQKSKEIRVFAEEIRVETLKTFQVLGFGHVGGAMSVLETVAVLYGEEMKYDPQNPQWPDRDWLVMSKGHAGPVLYATLALKGFMPREELWTLNRGGTNLPSHCDRNKTPGIDMTTGSLGQGVSTAIGVALGHKIDGKDNYTYLFVGDGECNEGQVWEGAAFAAQQKLDRLIWFVDYNKQQLDGLTKDILDMGDFVDKFRSFGFHTQKIDGHDIEAIRGAIREAKATRGVPSCIVLDTIKGKGCILTEGKISHHIAFKDDEMKQAIEEAEKVLEDARKEL